MTKDFSNLVDWKQIKLVKEDVDIADEKFFKAYQKRLVTHPLMEVKLFDWENSVNVSLIETEPTSLVNTTAIEKANELWKKEEFKNQFSEAATIFIEDVEEGADKFKELFETYPQVFFLNGADRKAMLGKTIIADRELKESMDILLKGIDLLFDKFDLSEIKKEYLLEHGSCEEEKPKKGKKMKAMYAKDTDAEEEDMEEPEAEEKEEKPEKKEKEPAPELSPSELGKLATEIRKLCDKCEDEGLKTKLNAIADKLEGGMEEGTRPDVVKEAISILSL
jgi:hypothetical protein